MSNLPATVKSKWSNENSDTFRKSSRLVERFEPINNDQSCSGVRMKIKVQSIRNLTQRVKMMIACQ